jgi:BASS family bile acid:Na+ symporter
VKTLIDVSVPILTLTMLFAVGLDLTSRDFARIRRQWAVVSAGLIGPLLLLPPIALLLIWMFRPAPEIAGSLLLIAACPIGGISNTYSYLARASPALSVTLTGVSCLLAGVTMPVIGRALEIAGHRALDLSVPMSALIGQLFLMLTVPVGVGMFVRHVWPAFAERHHASMQRLAFFGVATVLALIIVDNPQAFGHALPGTVPLAAVFVLCSTAAGWLTAAAVTPDPRDRFTIAAEFGTRNLGVAMAIAVTMLGRLEFARFAYIYFLSEMLMMLAAIAVFRRLRPLGGAPTGRSAGLAFARETERPGEAHHLL